VAFIETGFVYADARHVLKTGPSDRYAIQLPNRKDVRSMKPFFFFFIAAAVVASLSGCKRTGSESANSVAISGNAVPAPAAAAPSMPANSAASGDDQSQIVQAIKTHLAGVNGINMDQMEMTVQPATISGDEAHVTAELNYVLQRRNGGWVVTSNQPSGGQFDHPPMDQNHSQMSEPPSADQSQFPDFSDYLKKKDSQSSARK
jgi:hypothetical protein